MIQELWTKSDKTFGLKYTFEYDAKGQLTKTCQYTKDANTLDNCTAYKYDKSGNIVELEIFKSNGDLKRKQVIKYDNKGNEINVRNFDENGNFIDERNYKYQYDEKGNWVERIEYVNDFPKALRRQPLRLDRRERFGQIHLHENPRWRFGTDCGRSRD